MWVQFGEKEGDKAENERHPRKKTNYFQLLAMTNLLLHEISATLSRGEGFTK
jgi:hypothetical protein